MKRLSFLLPLLFYSFITNAQIKWQIPKPGTKPLYTNSELSSYVCDKIESHDIPGYNMWITYTYKDTSNHPLFLPCRHKGSYSIRRKEGRTGNSGDPFYCDVCNKVVKVYFYPLESIVEDLYNE